MLALDGGGIRGLITIQILSRLEALLREVLDKPTLVLADFFDYVGGTSTGAIIATCIALGLPTERIRNFYLSGAREMLRHASILKEWNYLHDDRVFLQTLREELMRPDHRDRTLGDEDIRTLLLLVMRNANTDSPWPISNNPLAKYNDRSRGDCNLDLPLWQLVRASTAAPIFFPPQEIRIGEKVWTFVDGALTVYNNPSFILFLMATLPEYRLEWEVGEEKLLLISIGTGLLTGEERNLEARQLNLLYNVKAVPAALIDSAMQEQDILCRIFGRCRFGDAIDSELNDLMLKNGAIPAGAFEPKKFTYVRYNPRVTAAGLTDLGLGHLRAQHVQLLDSAEHLDDLIEVGSRYASRVSLEHLGPFDPRAASWSSR